MVFTSVNTELKSNLQPEIVVSLLAFKAPVRLEARQAIAGVTVQEDVQVDV